MEREVQISDGPRLRRVKGAEVARSKPREIRTARYIRSEVRSVCVSANAQSYAFARSISKTVPWANKGQSRGLTHGV